MGSAVRGGGGGETTVKKPKICSYVKKVRHQGIEMEHSVQQYPPLERKPKESSQVQKSTKLASQQPFQSQTLLQFESMASPSFSRVVTLKKPSASNGGKCGSYTHDDGSYFVGDFDGEGIRSGIGHLELPSGATYDGGFAKGLPNGPGKYCNEFLQTMFNYWKFNY